MTVYVTKQYYASTGQVAYEVESMNKTLLENLDRTVPAVTQLSTFGDRLSIMTTFEQQFTIDDCILATAVQYDETVLETCYGFHQTEC